MAELEPKVNDVLKCRTRAGVKSYARKNGFAIRNISKRVLYVGSVKCTFDDGDRLLFVE